jgi:multisubunit Na+/H+ antiporter MnhE subunit
MPDILLALIGVAIFIVVFSTGMAAAAAVMAWGVRTGRIERHPAPPAPPVA